ncbi:MAG: DEAD/DEAH box helicase, partial [Pseudomonadales bacterium]|nr:DEAD/DEAH box helicase [Pseudomonadales bacterium]
MAKITLTISSYIFIKNDQVDDDLEKFIKKELEFFNPKIIELKRMGYSTWKVPYTIKCFSKLKNGYVLPTGFGSQLRNYLQDRGDEIEIIDKRVEKPIVPFDFQIELRPEQQEPVEKLLYLNRAILEAKPGFGKTMAALYVIAKRSQKTLIIVHTRALLHQWKKRIEDNFDLVKGDLGVIGEGKWQVGEKITIASYQTLLSRGTKKLKEEFGMVVIDECHHVPANTFTKVVRDFAAKYVLGLTATPFRKDKLDKMMLFYIGSLVKTKTVADTMEICHEITKTVPTRLIVRETDLSIADADEKEFTELGTILGEDVKRNELIVADVIETFKLNPNAKCIILSERVGHCEILFKMLQKKMPKVKSIIITGQVKRQEREEVFEKIKENKYQILVATGGVVGEGFDWPALDTLFLTYPFSWRGKLIQYVGRVQRAYPGKDQAIVYDYLDINNSMFKAMFRKRLQT